MKVEDYKGVLATLREIIKDSEFENHVYSVGGCERDYIAGRPIKDIDLVVDLIDGGIRLSKWLESNGHTTGSVVVYEHFGTTMFRLKEYPDIELEAVQTRKEAYHDMESRNPDTAFGTIKDDCTRRDFTYNAIYRNISTDEVCDFNGSSLKDLEENILKCCGEPDVIFMEDPLRIIRAVRFFSRFDSVIETNTYFGMARNVHRLSIISRERIQEEFVKILQSEHVVEAIELLFSIKAMKYIFSGMDFMDGFKKENLFEALRCVKNEGGTVTEFIATILYFDVKNVYNELRDLKFSNDVIQETTFILKKATELMDEKNVLLPRNIRKLEYECKSFVTFHKVATVYYAVTLDKLTFKQFLKSAKKHFNNDTSLFNYKLPVNGTDIMAVLRIEEGPEIKNVQNFLLEKVYKKPKMSKEDCITEIIKYYKK